MGHEVDQNVQVQKKKVSRSASSAAATACISKNISTFPLITTGSPIFTSMGNGSCQNFFATLSIFPLRVRYGKCVHKLERRTFPSRMPLLRHSLLSEEQRKRKQERKHGGTEDPRNEVHCCRFSASDLFPQVMSFTVQRRNCEKVKEYLSSRERDFKKNWVERGNLSHRLFGLES